MGELRAAGCKLFRMGRKSQHIERLIHVNSNMAHGTR